MEQKVSANNLATKRATPEFDQISKSHCSDFLSTILNHQGNTFIYVEIKIDILVHDCLRFETVSNSDFSKKLNVI